LMGDVRRVQALLRSALSVVDEVPAEFAEATAPEAAATEEIPGWSVETRGSQPSPMVVPTPAAADESEEIRKLAG